MEGLTGVAPAQGCLKDSCLTVRHQAQVFAWYLTFRDLSCKGAHVCDDGAAGRGRSLGNHTFYYITHNDLKVTYRDQ